MASYREHNFDPNAYEQPGPPLRPYNWVQWTGVALEVIGLGLFLAHLAGKIGWIDPLVGSGVALVPMIVGVLLINSRRQSDTLITPEQQARNKRTLIITIVAGVLIFAAVTLIELTGAN
jgi:uncharacterized membrane protein